MAITPEEYEAKRQAKIERLRNAADRASSESQDRYQRGHDMAEQIPFGQPILVGHHSEKRDRAYRGRIEDNFRASYELQKKAERLSARADAAESNQAIFSDDPKATEKLEEKLARLEKRQELMKSANRLVKKSDREGLLDMGFTEAQIDKLLTPYLGQRGFPSFALTNNNANIRRVKERIEELKAHANDQTSEIEINGVKIVDNTDDNRVQIFFPGKPSEATRSALKSHGFKWAPSVGAWQRQRGNSAMYFAKQIVSQVQP